MTHDQFKKAADYWKNKKQNAMPEEKLKKTVLEYINSNNTCALATGTGDYVRCTPIEYSYHDGKFWMFCPTSTCMISATLRMTWSPKICP